MASDAFSWRLNFYDLGIPLLDELLELWEDLWKMGQYLDPESSTLVVHLTDQWLQVKAWLSSVVVKMCCEIIFVSYDMFKGGSWGCCHVVLQ